MKQKLPVTEWKRIVAELNRLQAEIKEIEAKRDKLQPLIDENQEVLAEKKAKMEGRMKIYRQRLRDIYINGQINYLDVLLGAKDFSDFFFKNVFVAKNYQPRFGNDGYDHEGNC